MQDSQSTHANMLLKKLGDAAAARGSVPGSLPDRMKKAGGDSDAAFERMLEEWQSDYAAKRDANVKTGEVRAKEKFIKDMNERGHTSYPIDESEIKKKQAKAIEQARLRASKSFNDSLAHIMSKISIALAVSS